MREPLSESFKAGHEVQDGGDQPSPYALDKGADVHVP